MHKKGASQSEVLQEFVSRSYDRYYIELENAQVNTYIYQLNKYDINYFLWYFRY